VRIEREWRSGDQVKIELPMPVERVWAHPGVRQDAGRVALQRGPVVFCLEEVDNSAPVFQTALPKDAELSANLRRDMLDGVVVITGDALAMDDSDWAATLYRTEAHKTRACKITAIPYYAWANRKIGKMAVWIREC
jgi:hypothetical protein